MPTATDTRTAAAAKIAAAPVPTAADRARNAQSLATSKRHGGELRGNSHDRKVRTAKLLAEFGNGITCPCVYCGAALTASTLTQDKIYTAAEGGRYVIANLLPACGECNRRRGDLPVAVALAA